MNSRHLDSVNCLANTNGRRVCSSTLSLNSALDGVGGQRHAPAALPPGKKPGIHCTGGWVGPRMFWTGAKNPALHRSSTHRPSSLLHRLRSPGRHLTGYVYPVSWYDALFLLRDCVYWYGT